ncbi:MAG: hypothetical protein LBD21_01140 [Tannerellaceae bacterium]|jgi:hypothetical protein|nr:hypothetical protein [Tannerellaceae bacterium]
MNVRNRCSLIAATVIVCCALTAVGGALHAQVTIGSGGLPARAALLDLKSMDAVNPPGATDPLNVSSVTGGLLLPRVKLLDRYTLEPFIATSDADWQNNASTRLKEMHAGMMVYNISNRAPFRPGVYTWNGDRWMASHRPPIAVGHGLMADGGGKIGLGEQLSRPISFNTDVHRFGISGSKAVEVAVPVRLSGELRYTGSAYAKNRVIMSDADGNAVWEDNISPSAAPIATLDYYGVRVDLGSSNSDLRSTKATIQLPKGRWFVVVTMLASVINGTSQGRFWVESSFYKEDADVLDKSIFVGNNTTISGHIYDNYNVISGFVIIENPENRLVSYTYKVNKVVVIRPSASNSAYVNSYGSANAGENSIVAFALVQ